MIITIGVVMEDRGEERVSGASTGSQPFNSHQMLLLGILLCLIGGAMMLSSSVLSWVSEVPSPFMPEGAGVEWYITDLASTDNLYLLLYLIPVSGALLIVLSILSLLTEGGNLHPFSAIGSLATAVLAVALLGIALIWLMDSFIDSPGRDALFGPASYICVFGGVLCLAGGWMQLQAYLSGRRSHPMAKAVTFREPKRWEEPPTAEERCPGCISPVSPDWDRCPVCGRDL